MVHRPLTQEPNLILREKNREANKKIYLLLTMIWIFPPPKSAAFSTRSSIYFAFSMSPGTAIAWPPASLIAFATPSALANQSPSRIPNQLVIKFTNAGILPRFPRSLQFKRDGVFYRHQYPAQLLSPLLWQINMPFLHRCLVRFR